MYPYLVLQEELSRGQLLNESVFEALVAMGAPVILADNGINDSKISVCIPEELQSITVRGGVE